MKKKLKQYASFLLATSIVVSNLSISAYAREYQDDENVILADSESEEKTYAELLILTNLVSMTSKLL